MSVKNPIPSRLLLVTDRHQAVRPLEDVVGEALAAGVRWVWLRDRDLPPAERRTLAQRLLALTRAHGACLTVGGDPMLAAAIGADGVHLPGDARIAPTRAWYALLVGISAHDAVDVVAASEEDADYVTLGPIFATPSKPGYGPALGPSVIPLMRRWDVPILALGGVTVDRVAECLRAGAAGIAVMGEVMRAASRPGGVRDIVRRYLDAVVVATV